MKIPAYKGFFFPLFLYPADNFSEKKVFFSKQQNLTWTVSAAIQNSWQSDIYKEQVS